MTLTYWDIESGELKHRATGGTVTLRHDRLLQELPEDAMPSRARGDKKERTFNLLIRDGVDPRESIKEEKLIGKTSTDEDRGFSTATAIAGTHHAVLGEILDDHYVVGGEGKGSVRFLFPFHSFLPGTFSFYGQYKMFTGKVLAFLCQPADSAPSFNKPLIDSFYALFNGEDGLTLLDRTLIDIARQTVGSGGGERDAAADVLVERNYPGLPEGPGALLPSAHRRFQSDLETVLGLTSLNRRDRVTAAMNIFYVHLALYFQRLAWLLEEEYQLALDALANQAVQLSQLQACMASGWDDSPFAGSIEFRVSTGRSQPVRMADGCVTAYQEQNRRQLLLPANLTVLGAARAVMAACGQDARHWSFSDIAAGCRSDQTLEAAFSEALREMALATVSDRPVQDQQDIARQVGAGTPAIEVFREALLKTSRSALRRHGRDIVHGLVHRGGRGYIGKRGAIFFFELGQDLLLLLAKVIVRDRQMPFRTFLEELRKYGFAPQSRSEQDRLAETLRVLNLLEKHSDAGEAMYVKHFL